MEVKPLIRLWDSVGLGLVIICPSGVLYTNQTGGNSCWRPREEGVFAPLRDEMLDQEKVLYDYFTGPKWNSTCANGIDEESADFIDNVLSLSLLTKFMKVDRSRLKDSMEAWVYVEIGDQPREPPDLHDMEKGIGKTASGAVWRDSDYAHLPIEGWLYHIFGFGPSKGVITWTNSD